MKKIFSIIFMLFAATGMAQNVGIGTTTPTDQLHNTGTVRFQKYTGATTRLLQIDSSGRLIATAAGPVFSNNTSQSIPDNGCATGVGISSSITISGQPIVPIQSSRIAVKVNITHTYVGDLRIYLFPPGVNVLTLANGNGGPGDDLINTIFTDQAIVSISAGVAPFTGQYKPMGGAASCNITNTAVSDFSGIGFGSILPNGTWTLKVFDAAGGDVGVLNNWSISFTGPESITTSDENNFIPKLVGGNFMASNIYQSAATGNIGIGTTSPTLGRLVVRGSVGATVALFDDQTAGISLQSNLPSIGFNEYYNAGSKFISTGYGGKLALLTGSGDLGWYASNASGLADGAVTLNQRFGLTREGSMFVQGLDAGYVFKDRTSTNYGGWNLYANAGKASLYRYTQGGNTITVDSTGALGLQGVTSPTAPLSFPSYIGNKIALWGDASGGHYGMGIQGSLMQLYASGSSADIAFGYGSSAAFTENMRVKGNGNVGIGTNAPVIGGLVVNQIVGNTNAVFGANTSGVSIQSSYPGIGFNTYYNGGSYMIANGGAGYVGASPANGRLIFATTNANANAGIANQLYDKMWIENDGTVSLGSSNLNAENVSLGGGYRLKVYGKIISEEVRVQLKNAWPDYVYEKDYKKLSITDLEKFVIENKHLPNIPSAKEIEKDGQMLGDLQRKMMEKIEEMSLYIIDLQKQITELKKSNK